MERRKFVVGLGALATGTAAATGTGALSATEAERSLTVQIADDDSAYLTFDTDLGTSPDNNYEYASIEEGEMEIAFGSNDAGGDGVNPNSVNYFDDVFQLKNRGTEPLTVWVELGGGLGNYLDVYPIAGNDGRDTSLVGEDNAYVGPNATGVGSKLRVGIMIDTTDVDSENEALEGSITIHAESR